MKNYQIRRKKTTQEISKDKKKKRKKEKEQIRNISLKLYPSDDLRRILLEWFNIADNIYNCLIDIHNGHVSRGFKPPPINCLKVSA